MQTSDFCDDLIKKNGKNENKNENERQKNIKTMLSYYRNKNVIKHNLRSKKTT